MTRKSLAISQHIRKARKAKTRTSATRKDGRDNVVMPRLDIWCFRNRLATGPKPVEHVVNDSDRDEPRLSTCKIVSDGLVAFGLLQGRLRAIRFKRIPLFSEPCDEQLLDRLDPAWPGYQHHECEHGLVLQLSPDGACGRLPKRD
jgi:hypothetical protein